MINLKELTPKDTIPVPLPSGITVNLPMCRTKLLKWSGEMPAFNFGKKPIVNYKGNGVFAELVILRMLINSGWDGVWVETYGGIHYLQDMPTSWVLTGQNVSIPSEKEALLKDIRKAGETTACFDVFAWKGKDILFCEGKHKGKDKLTKAQSKFIAGALACGVSPQSLMVVEWEFRV